MRWDRISLSPLRGTDATHALKELREDLAESVESSLVVAVGDDSSQVRRSDRLWQERQALRVDGSDCE